jgi:hypothetical protein
MEENMKVLESIIQRGDYIFLKTAVETVSVSERKKKVGQPGSIWDREFGFNFSQRKNGQWLTDGGLARIGVSAVVLEKMNNGSRRVILSRFDDSHPTMPRKLSPPAGVWQSGGLKEAALNELGEEVIVTKDGAVVYWEYKIRQSRLLAEDWVNFYMKDHQLDLNTEEMFGIIDNLEIPESVGVYLDGKYQGEAILASEPENGGLEIMFVFVVEKNKDFQLADGEKLSNGVWLNREVNWYEKFQLKAELQQGNLTTKAEKILTII